MKSNVYYDEVEEKWYRICQVCKNRVYHKTKKSCQTCDRITSSCDKCQQVISKCSICGKHGHNKAFHNPSPTERTCKGCHRSFPIEGFFCQKKGINQKIYYTVYCKKCDSSRLKKRYRSSIEKRVSCIFNAIRHRSMKKNIPFNLTEESMLEQYHKQNGLCYYTKEPLVLETGKKSISIDRIVSKNGYTNGNIVFCQWIVNNMKWDTEYNEFIERCKKIYDNRTQ